MPEFTDEQYKAFERGTAYLEDMRACVVAYNKKHGTSFKYQFEMVHKLYCDEGLNGGEIASLFSKETTKTTIYARLRKMGIPRRGQGGANNLGELHPFSGGFATASTLARWYNVRVDTLWKRLRKPMYRNDLHLALVTPLRKDSRHEPI